MQGSYQRRAPQQAGGLEARGWTRFCSPAWAADSGLRSERARIDRHGTEWESCGPPLGMKPSHIHALALALCVAAAPAAAQQQQTASDGQRFDVNAFHPTASPQDLVI